MNKYSDIDGRTWDHFKFLAAKAETSPEDGGPEACAVLEAAGLVDFTTDENTGYSLTAEGKRISAELWPGTEIGPSKVGSFAPRAEMSDSDRDLFTRTIGARAERFGRIIEENGGLMLKRPDLN